MTENTPKITHSEFDRMLELAKTNKAMREALDQAKLIYELARPAKENLSPSEILEKIRAHRAYAVPNE